MIITRSPMRVSLEARLRYTMREKGLTEVRFWFDFEGTKILNQ